MPTKMKRIAVVTGGGSGIGAAVAKALAEDGWIVVLAGRRKEALEAVVAGGSALTGVLDAIPTDVTDEASVRSLFETTMQRCGRVDLLFNNAGIGAPSVDIDALELEVWNEVLAVNLTEAFLGTREAFRAMRQQQPQGGRIINNGSISAHAPRPRSIAYSATKHAITGLTKSTALDGRAFDIACGKSISATRQPTSEVGQRPELPRLTAPVRPEPLMDVAEVGRAVRYMANLPLDANVPTMTLMATKMPFIGRG